MVRLKATSLFYRFKMISMNQRKNKRMHYTRTGLRIALIGGFLFFVCFLIAFFITIDPFIDNSIAASTTTCFFGIIFAALFGRIGWSRNWLVDFLFNQISVWLFALGATATIVNNFLHLRFMGSVGISLLCAGIVMALLGIIFKTREEVANSLDS